MGARLDRDVRHALFTPQMSIAGVTAGDAVTGEVRALPTTMMPRPMGLEADRRCDRRVARLSLVMGNGSGPDGSSLTMDY